MEDEVKQEEKQEKQLLEPIKLPYEKASRLSKEEWHNYLWRKGRFSLDPEERAEGEKEYKRHVFWDITRMVTFGVTLSVIMCDIKPAMMPALAVFILSCILAHVYGCDGLWLK